MNFSRRLIVIAIAAPALVPATARPTSPAIPGGQPQAVLASHRALYSVALTATRPGADYVDVTGKMNLEFTDKCGVWSTRQKSMLQTTTGDGSEERSQSDFRASESKAGDIYQFQLKQTQGSDTTEYQGSATRTGANGAGIAEYTAPEHKTYRLPPHFVFQVAQQIKIIEAAKKGQRFYNGDLFDGTEGGGASHFNAVLLKPETTAALKPTIKDPLLDSPSYRVRIAFFPAAGTVDRDESGQSDDGDEPEYEMTMTLHENGVVSEYDYDYQDFSVHGKLEALQALPKPHC